VTRDEANNILWHCHNSSYEGHFNRERTAAKVLQSGFFWPTLFKDAHDYVIAAKELEVSPKAMKFHCKIFKRLKSLITWGSTL